MSKNNFDNNFNPSPFNDKNKDDLDEVLKECDIKNREMAETLDQLMHYLIFYKSQKENKENKEKETEVIKIPNWPLVFVCVKESHINIFTAMLERKNKDIILSFAWDWLKEHKQIYSSLKKEEFIKDFWNSNFENKLL